MFLFPLDFINLLEFDYLIGHLLVSEIILFKSIQYKFPLHHQDYIFKFPNLNQLLSH